MTEEKLTEKEFITVTDSIHDNQPGVYKHYRDKSHWLSEIIEDFGKKGYELYKRLPEDGITIFRKIKETLDQQKVKGIIDDFINAGNKKYKKLFSNSYYVKGFNEGLKLLKKELGLDN